MFFRFVTLAALAASVQAGPASSCEKQTNCVEFDISKVESPNGDDVCGNDDCHYKICMKIVHEAADGTDCTKFKDEFDTDTLSHSCVKSETSCLNGGGFSKSLGTVEEKGIELTHEQCQMVGGGQVAEFLLKDGNGCSGTGSKTYTLFGGYTATCEPRPSTIESCTGNGVGVECIWSIVAPSCTTDVTTIVTEHPQTTVVDPTTTVVDPTTTVVDPTTTVVDPTTTTSNNDCEGGGDPHFARWGREHDSFHGECDLVLIHSDTFHNGAGFDFHARTKIEDYFSFIETGAVRVGDNTVVFEKDQVHVNGARVGVDELPFTFGGDFMYTISDMEVPTNKNAKYYQYYKLDLHEDSSVIIKFYKKYMTYQVSGHPNDFQDAVGLMGEFATGEMIGRFGEPMDDFNQYGYEWQVHPEDPKLFLNAREPMLPYERCRMPTKARPNRRHLRATAIFEQAKVACAHLSSKAYDLCVDDVVTIGDVGIADTW